MNYDKIYEMKEAWLAYCYAQSSKFSIFVQKFQASTLFTVTVCKTFVIREETVLFLI